jgi:3-isopropylmalate dehydrogenase
VTVCEKANVLRETSGMMVDEAQRISSDHPSVQLRNVNIDALMMWATRRPEEYGVIVAGNMFGDIVSDAFAGLVGGMGFACSANIGEDVAIFEPSHGSAPKYALLDPSPVNPTAMILSGAMLLDHVGEPLKAERIRSAIASVVREGRIRTADLLHRSGGAEAFAAGASSTAEFTEAILEELTRLEMEEGAV